MATIEYKYEGEFTDAVKEKVIRVISDVYQRMFTDTPDDLLVQYIVTMISLKKSFSEISAELVDFIGNDSSVEFSCAVATTMMRDIDTNDSTPRANTTTNSSSSGSGGSNSNRSVIIPSTASKLLDEPLSSSRSNNKTNDRKRGREVRNDNSNSNNNSNISNNSSSNNNKRRDFNDNNGRSKNSNNRIDRNNNNNNNNRYDGNAHNNSNSSNYSNRNDFSNRNNFNSSSSRDIPVAVPAPIIAPFGSVPGQMNPALYREQMTAVARMQGFQSVDEMIFHQKEMIRMMQTNLRGGGGGDDGGRYGRGGYGGRSYVPGGRGRGRGRFGNEGSEIPPAFDSTNATTTASDVADGSGSDAYATESTDYFIPSHRAEFPSSYRGRGGGRFPTSFRGRGSGRGRGGRGGRILGSNEVWVREPDLESALSSSR